MTAEWAMIAALVAVIVGPLLVDAWDRRRAARAFNRHTNQAIAVTR